MPELPEVEITARRLNGALEGTEIESVLAPGMVTMKTFDPPLEALVGRTVTRVGRAGKMLIVEAGDLALLIHLMSAGRLQLWDKRASLRDRASRLLVRVADGRELRLREFGTQQRAWAKLLPTAGLEDDEAVAKLGPDAWPAPPLDVFAERISQARHLHSLLRDQRVLAGIGRSWVDEILWEVELSPFKGAQDLDSAEVARLRDRVRGGPRPRARPLRGGDRRHDPRQDADAAQGPSPNRRAMPALRHDPRGRPLPRLRDHVLPCGADRRQGP